MAGLKFALGMIPSTLKVESADENLRKEYQDFLEYEKSEELKHFLELETEVNSADFASRKKEILSKKYNSTEEYKKEKEFLALGKSKAIKNYFKVKDSSQLKNYTEFKNSDSLKKFRELEKFIESGELSKVKSSMDAKEFKSSDEAAKEKEFLSLKKNSKIKKHFKFENSSSYKEYLRISKSDELKKFEELQSFVNSEEFKDVKEYMKLSSKKKYELSDEYKNETEYNDLKKSDKVNWFKKIKKNNPFTEIEKWELSFEDQFESGSLDSKKWMTRYINGDKLMNKPYVLDDDIHAFTDGKNIDVSNGRLGILTKKEEANSLSWSLMFGFVDKKYNYTSDMISSAKAFNQKEGLFMAKVKLGSADVTQAFSLMTDEMLPHVDVFKMERNKLYAGNFWKNGKIEKSLTRTGGSRYTKDFFIYSLEWGNGKMTWKINDLVFKVQTTGLPEKEMHLCFNASLKETAKNLNLPNKMEIDWVKVYKKKTTKAE